MLDVHCHILPGVDDGSRSEEESLAMLAAAKAAGITKIVCTPHYKHSDYSQSRINEAFLWFADEADRIGIAAYLGNEIHWKKITERGIDDVAEHTIEDTSFALVEFSSNHDIGQLELRTLWKLKGKGITPILAHPERYVSIQKNFDLADELKSAGCLFQMSADAVEAKMLSGRRRLYKHLLKNGYYDFVASDAHRVEHYAVFTKALETTRAIVDNQLDFLD